MKKYKKNRKEKRAYCKNKKGIAPYQKREIKYESMQAQMPFLKTNS